MAASLEPVGLGKAHKRIRQPKIKPPFLRLESDHLHAVGGRERPELVADKLAFGASIFLRRITVHGNADEELAGELLPQRSRRQPGLLTMHREGKHQPEQGAYCFQLKEIRLHRNGRSM